MAWPVDMLYKISGLNCVGEVWTDGSRMKMQMLVEKANLFPQWPEKINVKEESVLVN